ncbi:MAG: hypothetical protein AB7K09_08680 [Planctomycetota bacterium]
MFELLADSTNLGGIRPESLVALGSGVGSAIITCYFWLIKSNRERAGIRIYQVGKWVPNTRTTAEKKIRVWWDGDLYLANVSSLANAVVGATVELKMGDGWKQGDYGWKEEHALPWNVPPQHVEKRGAAAFFEWEEGAIDPEKIRDAAQKIRFTFHTVDGRKYSKVVDTGLVHYSMPT